MSIAEQHAKDIASTSPAVATAVRKVLAAQKAAVLKSQKRSAVGGLDLATETTTTAAAVKPGIAAAVALGAGRVASVAGGTVDDDATNDLAGALAYKFAAQLTATTFAQVTGALADGSDIGSLFDTRSDNADAMADTTVSNAVNGGAQDYATSSDSTFDKQWTVTGGNPCADCEDADGETVGGDEDFSNGAPQPPIHSGCSCATDWTTAADESRSQRSTMTTRATLTAKERDNLNDSDFAYVDSDGEGHLPIHDEAHVRAALGRFSQTEFAADADKTKAAKAIVGAAKGFDIEIDPTSDVGEAAGLKAPESKSENPDTEERAAAAKGDDDSVACPTCDGEGSIKEGNVTCPLCKGDKTVSKAVAAKEAETKSARRPRRQRRDLARHQERRIYTAPIEVRSA